MPADDDSQTEHWFTNLSVADFMRDTSATDEIPLEAPIDEHTFAKLTGVLATAWIEQYREGRFRNHALLFNATVRRAFEMEGDETGAMFASRLAREAGSMQATVAHVATIGFSATLPPHQPTPDLATALATGQAQGGLCWLALRKPPNEETIRIAGFVPFNGRRQSGPSEIGLPDEDNTYIHLLEASNA